MAPKYKLVPATPVDVPEIMHITDLSLADNILQQARYPQRLAHLTPANELREWRMKKYYAPFGDPLWHVWKVVVENDAGQTVMAGTAEWCGPEDLDNTSRATKVVEEPAKDEAPADEPAKRPACHNDQLADEVSTAIRKMSNAICSEGARMWCRFTHSINRGLSNSTNTLNQIFRR